VPGGTGSINDGRPVLDPQAYRVERNEKHEKVDITLLIRSSSSRFRSIAACKDGFLVPTDLRDVCAAAPTGESPLAIRRGNLVVI
jgi:hypothetical protein